MSRLRTVGCEIGPGGAFLDGAGNGAGLTVTRDAVVFRSGVASVKCNTGATDLPSYHQVRFAAASEVGAVPVTVYARGYFRFSNLPDNIATIMRITTGTIDCVLTSAGKIRLLAGGIQQGSDSVETLVTGTWYRIELSFGIAVGANDTAELRLDGVTVASASGLNQADAAPTDFWFGWIEGDINGIGNNCIVNIDDIAINNNSGSDQNSWPGPGQIVLLLPISDAQVGSWTGGAGGTSNLFEAVNNTPPIGTASETDLTQIESIDTSPDNSTDEYRANMTDYVTAGIGLDDTIVVCQAVVDHGEDVTTGTKTGSFLILSNPAQGGSADAFTFGHNSGGLGTWPTGWRGNWGTAQYNPSVTYDLSPVMRLRKTDTGSRVASADLMGIYVEYLDNVPVMQSMSGLFSPIFVE